MKSAPFKKVFENNVDDKETFADSSTSSDIGKQMSKALQGPNRAFFGTMAGMLKRVDYKCKVIPIT